MKSTAELTEKQAEVLEYIKDFIAINHFSPTRSEIAEAFNVRPNAIQARLGGLVKKGAIIMPKKKSRAIAPVKGFKVRVK